MRFIFCGSRDLEGTWEIWQDLQKIARVYDLADLTIVHGDCPSGADQFAGYYADKLGMTVEPHPANWTQFNKAAGPIRNREMLEAGADAVFAYLSKPLHESSGTLDMVTIARDAGVTVHIRECF